MDSINKWLTFVANLGVIAGIVFLAFELRQTQDIAKAQIRNEISLATQERNRADMGFLAEIIARAESGEPMSALDETRVILWVSGVLSHLENVHYQHSQGLFDDAAFASQMNAFNWIKNMPGFEGEFCGAQARDPAFLAQAESMFPEICE